MPMLQWAGLRLAMRNAARVPKDEPLDVLAPLGCGLQTSAVGTMTSESGETEACQAANV